MDLVYAIRAYFDLINRQFSKEEFEIFMSCRYAELSKYHLGLGTWIRNNIIENDVALMALFIECGMDDLDDMSAFITDLFYIYSKSKEDSH